MASSVRRAFGVLTMVGAMTTGVGVIAAAPAAADAWSSCPDGYACFWNETGFSSGKWQFAGNNSNWGNYGVANQDESMVNDGNTSAVKIYAGTGYTGTHICVNRGNGWSYYPSYYPSNTTASNLWKSGQRCINSTD